MERSSDLALTLRPYLHRQPEGLPSGSSVAPGDTIDPMIKGLTLVQAITSPETFARLSRLFAALGFEAGRGWSDDHGQGSAFLAPLANLELVTGRLPATPSLLIEVTGLDEVHRITREWLGSAAAENNPDEKPLDGDQNPQNRDIKPPLSAGNVSEITETHWNSRLFSAAFDSDLRVGFWESNNPLHGQPVALEGDLSAANKRFAIVVARWNAVITDRLLQGSLDALLRSGATRTDVEIVRVPGAWEIPSAARTLAESKRYAAVITLGVLLRGETAHYEAIYNEVARGIGQSQQETGIPHAFGVLTCETLEQALDRAGLKAGNKGFEAGIAAIEMASVQDKIRENQRAKDGL